MRIGVVGTSWGLMHVGAFRAAGATIAGLCGRDPERTRAVAAREGIGLATTDLAALVTAVDAVVVASPDREHHRHVVAALDAGRHVLCEKPLTATGADALDLVARAGRLTCAVSFPYRMLPPLVALRAWLGERRGPRSLEVLLRNGLPPAPASADLGGASHVIDAACFLLDERPECVHARLAAGPTAHLCIGTSGGSTVVISHRPAAEPGTWGRWSFAGDGWEAGFSAGYRPERGGWVVEPPRVLDAGPWRDLAAGAAPGGPAGLRTAGGEAERSPLIDGTLEPWAQAHVETARAFLAAVRGAPDERLASFAAGAQVTLVLEAAARSERDGRRIRL